jgi:uncharacterized membrane protein
VIRFFRDSLKKIPLIVLLAGLWVAPTGLLPAEGIRFIGALHPLMVHLPLGLWFAFVMLLLAGTLRRNWVIECGLKGLMSLLLLTSWAAVITGWLWEQSGHSQLLLTQHKQWMLLYLFALHLFAGDVRREVSLLRLWIGTLLLSGLLGYGGHLGSVMVHGDPFAQWAKPTQAASDPFFHQEVYPILEQKCLACHQGTGATAGLQMQDAAGLWRGGVSGAAITSADATDSLLIQRIDLPKDHPKHMPPFGASVTAAERTTILSWIERGVSNE